MSRPPHVCIVSCQHVPDDVRVTHKVGMEMRQAGFRVTWVGPQRPRTGSDYGIDFRYYPVQAGRLRRLLRYRKARRLAAQVDQVDVFYGVEPDSACVAADLAKATGARAVFDIHEIYHDEMLGRWAAGPLRPVMKWLVRRGVMRTCSRCDLVVAVSDAVMAPYTRSPSDKLIVRNCAPASFADGAPAAVCQPGRPHFTLMHGKSTQAHGTLAVVEAVGLAARKAEGLRVILFDVFAQDAGGLGRAAFDEFARSRGAEQAVDLRAPVPMAQMKDILRQCDAGLVAYDRTWGVRSLPNKLFEYMAVGLPVIAPSYSLEIAKIVQAERCGVLVDCEKPEEIAEAILRLRSSPAETAEMGRRGREAFLARHNWSSEVRPMLDRIRQWSGAAGAGGRE